MKNLILSLSIFSLIACNGKGSDKANGDDRNDPAGPHPYGISERLDCDATGNPFKCVQLACRDAGGSYNASDKSCQCDEGKIFASQRGGICNSGTEVEHNTFSYADTFYKIRYFVRGKSDSRSLTIQEISSLTKNFSAPIIAGNSMLTIFRRGSDFKTLNEKLDGTILDLYKFGMPATAIDGVSLNGGIFNTIAERLDQFFILPSRQRIELKNANASAVLNKALEQAQNEFAPSSVYSFSNLGCAEICITKQVLLDSEEFKITRLRTYSSGNPINDVINLYNKTAHFIEASVVLAANQVSHYIERADGIYNLHSNDGETLVTVSDDRDLERGIKATNIRGRPVLVFEDGYSSNVDRVAKVGPYAKESYYGWFNSADNRSFLYGKKLSEWGEDYNESPSHAENVTEIASQGFTRPLIPFPSVSLINGDMLQKISALPSEKLVASISFGIPYDKAECLKSPMAQTFRKSESQILWVIGAGNSGHRMQADELVPCPQVVIAKNTLIVAASSGREDLNSASTYGEQSVDIVESGCRYQTTNCDAASATSYAAPRAARAIAELSGQFPQLTPEILRLAILLSARVPYDNGFFSSTNKFIEVRSGGFLDVKAAEKLINQMNGGSWSALDSQEVVKALVYAKHDQYTGVSERRIEGLVEAQIERLKKLY